MTTGKRLFGKPFLLGGGILHVMMPLWINLTEPLLGLAASKG